MLFRSNYMSGTAITIRESGYPSGAREVFFPAEQVIIDDIVAQCNGVVVWGEDFRRPQESHFQIDVEPDGSGLIALAKQIRGADTRPAGNYVGAPADAYAPARISKSRAVRTAARGTSHRDR